MRHARLPLIRHGLLIAALVASVLAADVAAGAPAPDPEGVPVETLAPVAPVVLQAPAAIGDGEAPGGEISPDGLQGTLRLRATPDEVNSFRQQSTRLPVDADIQDAANAAGAAPDPAGVDFDAMDQFDCCGGSASVPPDPHMAVGPDHIIEVVNVAFQIFDKTGTPLTGATTFSSFMSAISSCSGGFDPTVVYDEEADRYAIGVDGSGTDFCIAVTQTGNPLGAWNLYEVPALFGGANFHDYPHIGVGQDAVFVGANQFGPGFFEGRVWALDKGDMYSGSALTPVTFSTGGTSGTPQPLHFHGFGQGTWPTTSDHWFVTDPYNGDTLEVWRWPNPLGGGTPFIATSFDLEAATGVTSGFPLAVPQPSGGPDIEANDWRFRGFEYRNGSGWVADTVSCNPGGGSVDCVRWAEVDLTGGTPALVQAGVYGSSGQHRIFPDLAVNRCDDMAVGYTKGSSSLLPGIWVTGRQASDAPGTLQAEAELKAGETVYSSGIAGDQPPPYRWGDYSSMTIDPDGETFWYVGEYAKDIPATANWGTYIGSFAFAVCGGNGGGGDPTMHLQDNFIVIREAQNRAVGRPTVEDENSVRVSGATVFAEWTIDGVPQGVETSTTNSNGRSSFVLLDPPPGAELELCVTDITAAGLVYAPGDNLVPECVTETFPGGGGGGDTVHLQDNFIVIREAQNRALGRPTVEDQNGTRVSGATVSAEWSIDGVAQGVTSMSTNAQGRATFTLLGPPPGSELEFCVTDIVASGKTYVPGDNLVPECVTETFPGGGGGGDTMHLLSNTILLREAQNRALGRPTVEDGNGARVSGATVTSEWFVNGVSQGTTMSTTNSNGRVSIVLLNPPAGAALEFCVNDITATGLTYVPANNKAPECVTDTWPSAPLLYSSPM